MQNTDWLVLQDVIHGSPNEPQRIPEMKEEEFKFAQSLNHIKGTDCDPQADRCVNKRGCYSCRQKRMGGTVMNVPSGSDMGVDDKVRVNRLEGITDRGIDTITLFRFQHFEG